MASCCRVASRSRSRHSRAAFRVSCCQHDVMRNEQLRDKANSAAMGHRFIENQHNLAKTRDGIWTVTNLQHVDSFLCEHNELFQTVSHHVQ